MEQERFRLSTVTDRVTSKNPDRARWADVRLHALVVGLIVVCYYSESSWVTLVFGGILCFPTYLYLGFREGRRSPLWFSPLSFYFFWYSIGLGISAIYMGSVVSSGEWVGFSVARIPPEDIATGYVIYVIGSVALHAGIQWFRPTVSDNSIAAKPDLSVKRLNWLIVLWVLGLVNSWAPNWLAFLGAFSGVFNWVSFAATAAFAILPREWFRLSRAAFTMVLVIATIGLLAANLQAGSKAFIMFSFIPVIWLFIIRQPLRRWLPVFVLTLSVFYLGIVAPIMASARQMSLKSSDSTASLFINSFRIWDWADTEQYSSDFYWQQTDQFLRRQFDPIAPAYLVGDVRNNGFQLGSTMVYVWYAFIPRLIWPEKPSVTRGAWFATYIGFAKSEEEATTSLGITATGEVYWNYGIPGVIIGMFIIGCLLGQLWRLAGSDPRRQPLRMILYCLIMLNMPNMPEAVTVTHYIIIYFLIFKAAFFALSLTAHSKKEGHVAIAS